MRRELHSRSSHVSASARSRNALAWLSGSCEHNRTTRVEERIHSHFIKVPAKVVKCFEAAISRRNAKLLLAWRLTLRGSLLDFTAGAGPRLMDYLHSRKMREEQIKFRNQLHAKFLSGEIAGGIKWPAADRLTIR